MEAKEGVTTKAAPPAKQETQLQLVKRTVVDVVAQKVEQFITNGELFLPRNYSPDNAIKSAWLILQQTVDKDGRRALDVCTRDSIANSLLDMVVQGLNPMKKQGYFIPYGQTLTFQRSYFGSMAVAQMVRPAIAELATGVVYEGDTFKYGIVNGKKTVTLHEQDIDNVDKTKIKAAYAVALDKEGNPLKTEIMTIAEIKQSWKQSRMRPLLDNGNINPDSTHGKFTGEMALKTVANRLCKAIINASSDNALLLERINRNEELADRAEAEAEIEEHANVGETLSLEAFEENTGADEGVSVEKEEQPATPEEPQKEAPKKRAPGF